MSDTPTFTVTEFKAKCLDILDRLGSGKLERVEVTKRGKIMAVLTPPESLTKSVDGLFGCLKDQTFIPEGFDLTEPALDEPFLADSGILHS
jgi:antitoxin (DNA-binding transcriptional repressor) of toxin-antitoxin stability system